MATNTNFNSSLGVVKNSIVITQAGGLDPDAQAFITAAAITDATQITAVNQLVLDVKGYGLWNKLMALYPFVGGTAFSHKFNLKNPVDTDLGFRIEFNGGWTHSSTGILPNGVTAWGDTKFRPNNFYTNWDPADHLDDIHIAYYSRTDVISGADMGGSNTTYARGVYIMPSYAVNQYTNVYGTGSILTTSISPTTGFIMLKRDNSLTTIKSGRNGTSTPSAQNVDNFGIYPIALSAIARFNNTRTFFSTRELALASIGWGLTDTEEANFNTAVQAFQTTLGRNV
jgi:hypothetical protein